MGKFFTSDKYVGFLCGGVFVAGVLLIATPHKEGDRFWGGVLCAVSVVAFILQDEDRGMMDTHTERYLKKKIEACDHLLSLDGLDESCIKYYSAIREIALHAKSRQEFEEKRDNLPFP